MCLQNVYLFSAAADVFSGPQSVHFGPNDGTGSRNQKMIDSDIDIIISSGEGNGCS